MDLFCAVVFEEKKAPEQVLRSWGPDRKLETVAQKQLAPNDRCNLRSYSKVSFEAAKSKGSAFYNYLKTKILKIICRKVHRSWPPSVAARPITMRSTSRGSRNQQPANGTAVGCISKVAMEEEIAMVEWLKKLFVWCCINTSTDNLNNPVNYNDPLKPQISTQYSTQIQYQE
jgi:hypothetical protein